MPETRVSFEELVQILRERSGYLHARNLVLVALPVESASRQALALAQALNADWVDFDCELIRQLAADGWDEHVALERRGTLSIGRGLAGRWLQALGRRLSRERPLVVGNINLAVRYEIDVAKALYDASERGLCVIAAGGRLQGEALLIHGLLPQTGAGAPAYAVIPPAAHDDPAAPRAIQDRLL